MMTNGPYGLLRRAVTLAGAGARAAARAEAQAARAAAPRSGAVQLLAARLLALLDDYRGALDATAAALALDTPGAALQRYQLAREVGWYPEARAALERALATVPATAPAGTVDRLLEHVVGLCADAQDDDGAAVLLERYLPRARGSVALLLQAARIRQQRGDGTGAREALQRAVALEAPTETTRLAVASRLLELGDFDAAQDEYEALLRDGVAAAPALEALGRLCLWRGDGDGAIAIATRLDAVAPGAAVARRLRAAAAMLAGQPAAALALLDGVVADAPRDGEAWLWRAEAHLRLGDRAAAIADADRSQQCGYSFAARAVRLLAALQPGGRVHDATWDELAGELATLCSDAPAVLATNTSDGLAGLLDRALRALRGNRTPLASWVRDDGALASLPRSRSIRLASRRAMELIKIAPAAVALERLDALVAAHPRSSMPLVHRGELQLWLGDWAAARADLEGAIAVHRQTRWAWYGLACLDLVAGEPERALATCAEGIRVMHNTEGPVAFLYRGEAYRLLGRLDEARQQLERSCALHQSRLSAWVNLALVHAARDDRAAQAEVVRRLARVAPALLAEAAATLGEATFTAVVLDGPLAERPPPDLAALDQTLARTLHLMRGNRSSSVVTYCTGDGVLRHVPQSSAPSPQARARALARLRELLDRVR